LHQELAELAGGHDDHDHAHDHSHDHKHDHGHDHHDHAHAEHKHDHGHDKKHEHKHAAKSKRMPEQAVYVLEKMSHGFKRMGRAYGGGFYDYPEGEPKQLWDGLKVFSRGAKEVPIQDIKDRILYIQALETLRCLEEGVLMSTRDANIGSIFGWGFPAYTGGTAQFVNHIGVAAFTARAKELAAKYGERFNPPHLLEEHAKSGKPI
jgi:3-hydroxyacyl-CoA dehydrogenase / enoyl-CoA hydratase / 3-hydroxybutyryl-CoA epimerase